MVAKRQQETFEPVTMRHVRSQAAATCSSTASLDGATTCREGAPEAAPALLQLDLAHSIAR
jgi:hypothetical protein